MLLNRWSWASFSAYWNCSFLICILGIRIVPYKLIFSFNEIIHIKGLAECLALGKCLIKNSWVTFMLSVSICIVPWGPLNDRLKHVLRKAVWRKGKRTTLDRTQIIGFLVLVLLLFMWLGKATFLIWALVPIYNRTCIIIFLFYIILKYNMACLW